MTDEQTPAEQPENLEGEEVEGQAEGQTPGGKLRQELNRFKDENKELKAKLRDNSFRQAGFDPESGHGKALSQLYDGEPDPEQVKQAAEEYGFQPNLVTPAQAQTEEEVNREQAGQRVEQVQASSQSTEELSIEDQWTQAQQEGDWQRAGALKSQALNAQYQT